MIQCITVTFLYSIAVPYILFWQWLKMVIKSCDLN